MRYIMIILMLAASLVLFAQEFKITTPDGGVTMSITGVQSNGTTTSGNIIDQIAAKMEQLEKDIHSKLNKLDQKKAENIMNEIYGLLALLPDNTTVDVKSSASTSTTTTTTSSQGGNININITGMETNEPEPVVKPVPAKPKVVEEEKEEEPVVKPVGKSMPESDFNGLVSRIKGESFADDQIRVLRTAAKNYKFSCNQIVRLIGCYNFSEEKLEALRISYPGCTDPQNNYKILDAFTYSSDKETADEIINQ